MVTFGRESLVELVGVVLAGLSEPDVEVDVEDESVLLESDAGGVGLLGFVGFRPDWPEAETTRKQIKRQNAIAIFKPEAALGESTRWSILFLSCARAKA